MNYNFAERVSQMESSVIREILKVTERPEVISFAGGLPAPELFPIKEIKEAFCEVLEGDDPSALQYSTTEGYLPLRGYIAARMREKGVEAGPDNILITNGSQQALDLLAKLFVDPGDVVLVEKPSYLGAIQTFRSYQAGFCPVPTDDQGIDIDALELAIKKQNPKMIYLTPTFKNPTGVTMSLERRRAAADLLGKYGVPLIEDDPYGDLRYSGEPLPPVKSFDDAGRVIYLSTFSKTIAPGLRLGWIVAGRELIRKLVLAKQGTDLHTGTLVQRAVYRYLEKTDVSGHVLAIRREYGRRRDIMLEEMRQNFPEGISWTRPDGGMFLWVTMPEHIDTIQLLERAVEENVAYVPGAPFYTDREGLNTMRLNFSNSTPHQIKSGIRRLARLFASCLH
ncbi:PLP-dependent aminotransferase family protein [Pelotomaculum propionicicum]|uniref:aminotransferase-like domain-containing protein n=1 Tax=Pelotomaculum propionicicum TaxID=258475 RepID=UPI003B7E5BE6